MDICRSESLQILPVERNISMIQKCYIPSVYLNDLKNFKTGSYVLLQVSSHATCVCRMYWKSDLQNSFCYVDDSIVAYSSLRGTKDLPTEEINLVNKKLTLKQIKTLPTCVSLKKLSVSIIFETVVFNKRWKKHPDALLDIIKNILKLYVLVKGCVVYTRNLNNCQKFGVYCIVIHDIGNVDECELTVGKVVSGTKIFIAKQVSRVWLEQLQKRDMEYPLGGLNGPYQLLQEILSQQKQYQQSSKKIGIRPCHQALVVGPSGCGKTSLVRRIAADCGTVLVSVLGPEAYHAHPGDTESWLRSVFEEAIDLAQEGVCILLLDEVDSLCPKRGAGGLTSHQARASSQLLMLLDQADNVPGLIVIGTTNRPNGLDPAVRRIGRLETEVHIGVPTESERVQILQVLLKSFLHNKDELCCKVAHLTPGYVGADLALLCQDVLLSRCRSKKIKDSWNSEDWLSDFQVSIAKSRPSSLRGGLGVISTQSSSLLDIGGLSNIKQSLCAAVEWPLLYPETFAKFGLPHPKGILLYGPPGCAKTSLARAFASSMNVTFLSISAAELYSPYVGDAEKSIGELFHRARVAAPTILFIDEIDALVGSRGHRESGVQERVLSTLLTEMDGIGNVLDSLSTANNGVMVMAATNRPDMLDEALLRPGRFDKLIHVHPPDIEERLDILKILTAKTPLGDCVDLQHLALATDLFSGADLNNLCREAALCAITEEGMTVNQVKQKHFMKVLLNLHPSLSLEQIDWYNRFKIK